MRLAVFATVAMLLGVAQPASAAPGWPVLSAGSTGPDVSTAQHLLRHHGHGITADGAFGPQTRAAVVAFQQARGFTADGIIGARTRTRLVVTVSQGTSGDAVRTFQPVAGLGTPVQVVDVAYASTSFFTRAIDVAAAHPDSSAGQRAQAAL